MRVIVATGNQGKLGEYQRLLADVPDLVLESMATLGEPVEIVEDGETFVANALKKARAVAAVSGMVALADDSGLEVDALGGRPGVHSARYAGEGASDAENNEKLLDALTEVPEGRRTARFRCTIALVDAMGTEIAVVDGTCEGRIVTAPRGQHGFGYDPLFVAEGRHKTMAELSPDEKNQISHRAQAASKLKAALRR